MLLFAIASVLLLIGVYASYHRVASTADYFTLDSQRNIAENNNLLIDTLDVKSLVKSSKPFGNLESRRPLSFVSFGINYYYSAFDGRAYRWTNVVILALCGIGVMALAYLILLRWTDNRTAMLAAIIAAAVWTLHPLQTNMTTYVVQRMVSLAILGYVWGFVFYILGERVSPYYWLGTLFFGAFGMLSKEIAWYLPLGIAAYRFAWDDKFSGWFAQRKWIWAVLALAALGCLIGVASWKSDLYSKVEFNTWQRLLSQARILWLYAFLFFVPLPSLFNLDRAYDFSPSLFSPMTTFPSVLGHLVLIGLAFWFWRRYRLVSLLVLSYYGHHVMESSFLGLELAFEHRMCLPSIFIAILVGYSVLRALGMLTRGDGKMALVPALVIALVCGGSLSFATKTRNYVWEDHKRLVLDVIAKSPGRSRSYQALGRLYLIDNDVKNAELALKKALELDPDLWQTWTSLGILYVSSGRFGEAKEILERQVRQGIPHGIIYQGLGVCYLNEGDSDTALRHFKRSIELLPLIAHSRAYIATIYSRSGQLDLARKYAREELKINPPNRQARMVLAGQTSGQSPKKQ
jgi:tetratricopeptide (TPR) repeat protein